MISHVAPLKRAYHDEPPADMLMRLRIVLDGGRSYHVGEEHVKKTPFSMEWCSLPRRYQMTEVVEVYAAKISDTQQVGTGRY